eukprot:4790290-Prymnesium_polylepis.1
MAPCVLLGTAPIALNPVELAMELGKEETPVAYNNRAVRTDELSPARGLDDTLECRALTAKVRLRAKQALAAAAVICRVSGLARASGAQRAGGKEAALGQEHL